MIDTNPLPPQARVTSWFACGCRSDVEQLATSIVPVGQSWPCRHHGEQLIIRVHAHLLRSQR